MLPGQRDKSGSMAHVSPPSQGAQPCPGECMKLAVLKGQALPSPSFCAGPGRRPLMWRAEEEEWPCARAASQERNEPLLPPAQLWVQLMGPSQPQLKPPGTVATPDHIPGMALRHS